MPSKVRISQKEVLSINEAAAEMGVGRQTIYYWMDANVLPFVRWGNSRLIHILDLRAASEEMAKRKNGRKYRGVSNEERQKKAHLFSKKG